MTSDFAEEKDDFSSSKINVVSDLLKSIFRDINNSMANSIQISTIKDGNKLGKDTGILNQISQFKIECDRSQNELVMKKKEIEELKLEYDDSMQKSSNEFEEEKNLLCESMLNLSSEISLKSAEIKQLLGDVENLRISSLTNDKIKSDIELSFCNLTTEFENYKNSKKEEHENEMNSVKTTYDENEEKQMIELGALQIELDGKTAEFETEKNKNATLTAQIENLKISHESICNELDLKLKEKGIKNETFVQNTKKQEEEFLKLYDVIEELKKEVERSAIVNEELINETETLKLKLSTANEVENEIGKVEQENEILITKLREEIEVIKTANGRLEDEINILNENNYEEIMNLTTKMKELEENEIVSNLCITNLERTIETIAETENVLRKEIEESKAENKKLSDILNNTFEENAELSSKYDALTSDNAELSSKYDALTSDNAELSSKYDALTSDNAELSSKYDALTSDNAELSSKYDALTSDNAELSSKLIESDLLRLNIIELRAEIDVLKNQNLSLENKFESNEHEEIEKMNFQNRFQNENIIQVEKDTNKEVESLKKEIENLNLDLANAEDITNEIKSKLDAIIIIKDDAVLKLEIMGNNTKSLESIITGKDEEINKLELRILDIENSMEEKSDIIDLRDDLISELRASLLLRETDSSTKTDLTSSIVKGGEGFSHDLLDGVVLLGGALSSDDEEREGREAKGGRSEERREEGRVKEIGEDEEGTQEGGYNGWDDIGDDDWDNIGDDDDNDDDDDTNNIENENNNKEYSVDQIHDIQTVQIEKEINSTQNTVEETFVDFEDDAKTQFSRKNSVLEQLKTVNQMKCTMGELEFTVNNLTEAVYLLRNQNEDLQIQIFSKNEELQNFENSALSAITFCDQQQIVIDTKNEEINQLKSLNSELQKDTTVLAMTNNENPVPNSSNLEEELSRILIENDELKINAALNDTEISTLQNSLQLKTHGEIELRQIIHENQAKSVNEESMKKEIETKFEEIQNLKQNIEESKEQLSERNNSFMEIRALLEKKECEIDVLQIALQTKENECAGISLILTEKEEINVKLTLLLDEREKLIEEFQISLVGKEEEMNNLEFSILDKNCEIDSLKSTARFNESLTVSVNSEVEHLEKSRTISPFLSQIRDIEKEALDLKSEVEMKSVENEMLRGLLQDATEENEKSENENGSGSGSEIGSNVRRVSSIVENINKNTMKNNYSFSTKKSFSLSAYNSPSMSPKTNRFTPNTSTTLEVEKKEIEILEFKELIRDNENEIQELKFQVMNKENEIEELQIMLGEKNIVIEEFQRSKIDQLLREKDGIIDELRLEVEEKETDIGDLEALLEEKRIEIDDLLIIAKKKDDFVLELMTGNSVVFADPMAGETQSSSSENNDAVRNSSTQDINSEIEKLKFALDSSNKSNQFSPNKGKNENPNKSKQGFGITVGDDDENGDQIDIEFNSELTSNLMNQLNEETNFSKELQETIAEKNNELLAKTVKTENLASEIEVLKVKLLSMENEIGELRTVNRNNNYEIIENEQVLDENRKENGYGTEKEKESKSKIVANKPPYSMNDRNQDVDQDLNEKYADPGPEPGSDSHPDSDRLLMALAQADILRQQLLQVNVILHPCD